MADMLENRTCRIALGAALGWLALAGAAASQDIFERYADRAIEAASPAEGTALRDAILEQMQIALQGADVPSGAEVGIETLSAAPSDIIMVESLDHDRASGRFTAIILATDGARVAVHGRAPVTVPVWMPIRRLEAGEIVAPADLAEFRFPLAALKPSLLLDRGDMMGKEVRRSLHPERPVSERSLIEPRIVLRGAAVTISYDSGPMALAAPGRAMEDGGTGQSIRVLNTQSNKIVHAEVLGDGRVRVGPEGEPS